MADCTRCKSEPQKYASGMCRECHKNYMRAWYRKNRDRLLLEKGEKGLKIERMWASSKVRAKKNGLEFNIEKSDIVIGDRCPVLGIEYGLSNKHVSFNSPTLDRLIPSLGYTKGNICVISHRANIIKSDGSSSEILAVYNWVEKALNQKN